jgi:gliding motility-associated-like protein
MIYTVTMTDSLGCFTIAEKVDLKVILESLIGMPTAFTPNADGSNDLAIPRGWGVKQFVELRIYNRWGQVVFVTNEKDKGWDGVYNGRPADPDTFGWTITYIDNDDKEQFKKGYITLLR